MSNLYEELKNKHLKEIAAFPMKVAFCDGQFKEVVDEWDLSFDENSDNYYGKQLIPLGFGKYIRKKDARAFNNMLNHHRKEHLKAIEKDTTGEGYIYDMFVYELQKHKYKYTSRVDEILKALNISMETLLQNAVMSQAFAKACQYIASLDIRKEVLNEKLQ